MKNDPNPTDVCQIHKPTILNQVNELRMEIIDKEPNPNVDIVNEEEFNVNVNTMNEACEKNSEMKHGNTI